MDIIFAREPKGTYLKSLERAATQCARRGANRGHWREVVGMNRERPEKHQ